MVDVFDKNKDEVSCHLEFIDNPIASRWQDALNTEIHSMYDNSVLDLCGSV